MLYAGFMTTNEELKQLIDEHRLVLQDVAEYTESALDSVKGWCSAEGSARYRNMPKSKLKLLKMELNAGIDKAK